MNLGDFFTKLFRWFCNFAGGLAFSFYQISNTKINQNGFHGYFYSRTIFMLNWIIWRHIVKWSLFSCLMPKKICPILLFDQVHKHFKIGNFLQRLQKRPK